MLSFCRYFQLKNAIPLFRPAFYFSSNEKLIEFTEIHLKKEAQDKKIQISKGRSWKPSELRLKSNEDLHKLWYVLLKEKNLLLTEAKFRYKLIGSHGRNGRLTQVKMSMARLLTVVNERKKIREDYWRQLEDEYIEKRKSEFDKLLEKQKQEDFNQVMITPELLRAKLKALKAGVDNTDYIDKALQIKQEKIKFKQYLDEKYNYKKGEVKNSYFYFHEECVDVLNFSN